jgi:DNA/RNA-binding domain of Phe-tRNA-synthetase-like protein
VTTLAIDRAVRDAFGEAHVVAVVADGIDNAVVWPELEPRLVAVERSAAETPGVDDPRIASWHAAYRRFGTNPRRQRPSVDALTRRLARTGRLPRISPLVDCYNVVSVTHVVPAGAFDLDHVHGDITIRFARPGDAFIPLGEPDTVEQARDGEVVYADAGGVLTRHWNHRDAERTKVTRKSRRVLTVLEAIDAAHHASVDEAADDLAALLGPHAQQVTVRSVDPTGSPVRIS